MKIKTMTRMDLLSAIPLTIFWVEAQIPMPISVPGVKLGLANLVTMVGLYCMTARGEDPEAAHQEALKSVLKTDVSLTQEQIDAVYNGTKVPTMGDGE